MSNVYSPPRHAFAQTGYKDQMGTALPGALAFASDSNLVDAMLVGAVDANGLQAGLAVIATAATDVQRPGINEQAVVLPKADSTAEHIVGVVVRNQQMRTNAAGHACYFAQDMCTVARMGRSGARIWVQLAEGAQPVVGGAVSVIVSGAEAGKFAATGGVTVPAMKFASAAADGMACVELL